MTDVGLVTAHDPCDLARDGLEIAIDRHRAAGGAAARATVVIVHGLKGFKDYGPFPYLAARLAGSGAAALRVSLSHSGIPRGSDRFDRADLFERDAWNEQVADLATIVRAIRRGAVDGCPADRPVVLLGHSRGGLASLLHAGRAARDGDAASAPDGVLAAAAPAACDRLPPVMRERLLEDGFLPMESARTGEMLRVGRVFLESQLASPEDHDLPSLLGHVERPIAIVHGEADPTVSAEDARTIARAAHRCRDLRRVIVAGANHVFDVAHPHAFDSADDAPASLRTLADVAIAFTAELAPRG